jgi:hypothetical protein
MKDIMPVSGGYPGFHCTFAVNRLSGYQRRTIKMNITKRRGTFIRFEELQIQMISDVIKRTGERKVDFFKRIVETEHTRIMQGTSIPESVNETLGMLLAQIKETNSTMKTLLDNTKATRDGVNTIFPATLFLMRELYRLTHFIVNAFIKNGVVQPQQMTAFITESNAQACQSFNAFYHTVMNTSSKGIVDLLKKG